MNKLDYGQMTKQELVEYFKENKNNDYAWSIFFHKLENSNQGIWHDPETTSTSNVELIARELFQMLGAIYCQINIFYYDAKQERAFILATNTRAEEIQIEIASNGKWRILEHS